MAGLALSGAFIHFVGVLLTKFFCHAKLRGFSAKQVTLANDDNTDTS